MTQYELPDGFHPIDSIPNKGKVNIAYANGEFGTIDVREKAYSDWERAGWAPIVPLKRKARFVVEIAETLRHCKSETAWKVWDTKNGGYGCVAFGIPTRESAQRIADIYNEGMP